MKERTYQNEVDAFRRLQAENKYMKEILRAIVDVDTRFIHEDAETMRELAKKGLK